MIRGATSARSGGEAESGPAKCRPVGPACGSERRNGRLCAGAELRPRRELRSPADAVSGWPWPAADAVSGRPWSAAGAVSAARGSCAFGPRPHTPGK